MFAAGALGTGLLFLVVPAVAIDVWPWQLTPLTARVLASLTVQVGVGALVLSFDPRWSAWRLIVQTFLVATALLLIGAVRAFGDFDTSNPLTWLYLGGLLATAGALAVLHRQMEGPIGEEHSPGTPDPQHVGARSVSRGGVAARARARVRPRSVRSTGVRGGRAP